MAQTSQRISCQESDCIVVYFVVSVEKGTCNSTDSLGLVRYSSKVRIRLIRLHDQAQGKAGRRAQVC